MMQLIRILGLALLVSAFGCGSDEPSEDELCHGPDGTLAPGETYGDPCNLCTCNVDLSISCEETADCADCTYEGEGYSIGQTWGAGDGCNICQCEAKDSYSCTETACN